MSVVLNSRTFLALCYVERTPFMLHTAGNNYHCWLSLNHSVFSYTVTSRPLSLSNFLLYVHTNNINSNSVKKKPKYTGKTSWTLPNSSECMNRIYNDLDWVPAKNQDEGVIYARLVSCYSILLHSCSLEPLDLHYSAGLAIIFSLQKISVNCSREGSLLRGWCGSNSRFSCYY